MQLIYYQLFITITSKRNINIYGTVSFIHLATRMVPLELFYEYYIQNTFLYAD